jgi:hypothetical protein
MATPQQNPWVSINYSNLKNPYLANNDGSTDYDFRLSEDQPFAPTYHPVYDPLSMGLYDKVAPGINAINLNTRGLDAYRNEALRTNPSRYAELATEKENLNETAARDRARGESAAKQADAASDLAMHGGLDSGARERLARGSNSDFLNMSQEIGKQAEGNRQQIAMNDEQNRISQLGALPGMEAQSLQPEFQKQQMLGQANQFDIGNAINEGNNKNAFTLGRYHEAMSAWGANKQAQATANSGKK